MASARIQQQQQQMLQQQQQQQHSPGSNAATVTVVAGSAPGVASKPLAATMKGKIASRAHSFKENILEAFGHHSHHSHGSHHGSSNGNTTAATLNCSIDSASNGHHQNGHHLSKAKKTSSTDNLIGYSSNSDPTESLVRDVQLSLRYLEDAVSKGTLELLPGCASVVLERVAAIQAFALRDRGAQVRSGEDKRTAEALDRLYSSVSALVRWADGVVVSSSSCGSDPALDNASETVVEPVRRAVLVLVNRLAQADGAAAGNLAASKASGLHNSLPDISSSQQDLSQQQKDAPRLPKRREHKHHCHRHHHHHHHHKHHHHTHGGHRHKHRSSKQQQQQQQQQEEQQQQAPPLPPKMAKQPSSSNAVTLADPTAYGQADWFSNPLFENSSNNSRKSSQVPRVLSCYETSFIGDARPASPQQQQQQQPKQHQVIPSLAKTTRLRPRPLLKSASEDVQDFSSSYNFPYMDELASPSAAEVEDSGRESSSNAGGAFFPGDSEELDLELEREEKEGSRGRAKPPALPRKEARRKKSQYDNVWESSSGVPSNGGGSGGHSPAFLTSSQSFDLGRQPREPRDAAVAAAVAAASRRHRAEEDGRRQSDGGGRRINQASSHDPPPPPLPPKKRDIINYMEMLGQSLLPTREDLMQSLAQTQLLLRNVWADNYHQFGEFIPADNSVFNHFPVPQDLFTQNVDLSWLDQARGLGGDQALMQALPPPPPPPHQGTEPSFGAPPALPPKKNRSNTNLIQHQKKTNKERIIPIVRESDGSVVTPHHQQQQQQQQPLYGNRMQQQFLRSDSGSGGGGPLSKRFSTESTGTSNSSVYSSAAEAPPERPESTASSSATDDMVVSSPAPSYRSTATASQQPPPPPLIPPQSMSPTPPRTPSPAPSVKSNAKKPKSEEETIPEDSALNRYDGDSSSEGEGGGGSSGDWMRSLIYASNSEGILELRAGDMDELIVLATQTANRDFVYQDAFLLTYRTFVPTLSLLHKLRHRFRRLSVSGPSSLPSPRLRAARSSFSLLVRVVDSLIECDLNCPRVRAALSGFVSELVASGELLLARALRTKFMQKHEEHRAKAMPELDFGRLAVHQKPPSILQFKSSELAEQITLMDHQHFVRLEPGELLLWVKEQNEEKSPNLVRFTKHFNAMSFWCRTCILTEPDSRERERLAGKFIKVMKCLRKHNNFNSYLAFLSALDSASIRRLDWPRSVTDTIGEYSAIIDFSGSFKAYREALANASPPLIPYMGLVLQDLTFVHIGNSDTVKGGKVNFAKRWQQYNILDNVRRFKRAHYPFTRREDIARCFGDFERALPENRLWELSERIKPRLQPPPPSHPPHSNSSDQLLSNGHGGGNSPGLTAAAAAVGANP